MTRATGTDPAAEGLPTARLWLARAALLWEGLWPALWPAVGVAGLFLVTALFDLLPALPGWLHLAALVAFAAAFVAGLARGLAVQRWPDAAAARRRLERASGTAHRPLTALADRLAAGGGDAGARALWEAYRRRLLAQVKRLRVGVPQAGLARRDPRGLRAALGLLLIIALVAAGDDGLARLNRAALPDLPGFGHADPASLDLWITPPAYTGVAPIFLTTGATPTPTPMPAAPALTLPAGSRVLAQVQGGRGQPDLRFGDTVVAFNEIDPGSYRAEGEIRAGDELSVEQRGRRLAVWPLRVLPDAAPAIDFAGPPQRTERATLRLDYDATDDYGLESVRAIIRRADGAVGPGTIDAIDLALPLPGVNLKAARAASYHDLTPHPWAGIPVELRLEARDALGQTGASEPFAMTLPERIFNHPVARAIVDQRKQLTLAPNDRLAVRRALAVIAARPLAYGDDVVVALALRTAERRLFHDRSEAAIGEIQSLLWDTALRLEEGDLAIFERELRAAQQALQQALAGDAPDDEIERLMDQLQAALDRFLSALAERMRRDAEALADAPPLDPNATVLQREDLQRLLDQARELARTGAREAARNLLSQLQEMLENLKSGQFAGQPQPGAAEAMRLMRDLDGLTQRQQELLNRSFRQSQQMRPGDPAPNTLETARNQEGLRRALGEVMRRFGELTDEIPRPLGRAEMAMRDAVEALRQGAPDAAIGPQTQALNELQQGARAMAEAFTQQFGPQPGIGQERFGQARDPLGRLQPGMGMIDTGDVALPEEADMQRAREILDELRRRAGERTRPRLELDYIDRLLRRF